MRRDILFFYCDYGVSFMLSHWVLTVDSGGDKSIMLGGHVADGILRSGIHAGDNP